MRPGPTSLLAALLLGFVANCARADELHLAELTVDEVAQKAGRPGVHLYDCNPQDVFKDGHVPSARWVDYDKLTGRDLPASRAETLVFYCANEH